MYSIKLIFKTLSLFTLIYFLGGAHWAQAKGQVCDSQAPCDQRGAAISACKKLHKEDPGYGWDKQVKRLETTRADECKVEAQKRTNQAEGNNSARKQIKKHNQLTNIVTLINGGMATYLFTQCPADTTRMTCFMGLMSMQQAIQGLFGTKKHKDISGNLASLQPLENKDFNAPEAFNPGFAAKFDTNGDGTIGPGDIVPGCVDCEYINLPQGEGADKDKPKLGLKTPDGDIITEEDAHNLDAKTKAKINNRMKLLQENPPTPAMAGLFQQLEELEEDLEEEEEEEEDLQAQAGGFSGGDGVRSLSGNQSSSGKKYRRRTPGSNVHSQFAKAMGRMLGGKKGKQKKHPAVKIGNDRVGAIQDNIFAIVTRRYQERDKNKQFIPKNRRIPATYL